MASPRPSAPAAAKARKTSRARRRRAAPAKRKLSFKDKHALETLPARIADLRTELGRLDALLGDPRLHARDAEAFQRASNDYGVRQRDLERAEEEWLTLEMLREEIEG